MRRKVIYKCYSNMNKLDLCKTTRNIWDILSTDIYLTSQMLHMGEMRVEESRQTKLTGEKFT